MVNSSKPSSLDIIHDGVYIGRFGRKQNVNNQNINCVIDNKVTTAHKQIYCGRTKGNYLVRVLADDCG